MAPGLIERNISGRCALVQVNAARPALLCALATRQPLFDILLPSMSGPAAPVRGQGGGQKHAASLYKLFNPVGDVADPALARTAIEPFSLPPPWGGCADRFLATVQKTDSFLTIAPRHSYS